MDRKSRLLFLLLHRISLKGATSEHAEAFHAALLQAWRCESDGLAEHRHGVGSLREIAEIARCANHNFDGRVVLDRMQGQLGESATDEQSSVVFREDGSEVDRSNRPIRLKVCEKARRIPR